MRLTYLLAQFCTPHNGFFGEAAVLKRIGIAQRGTRTYGPAMHSAALFARDGGSPAAPPSRDFAPHRGLLSIGPTLRGCVPAILFCNSQIDLLTAGCWTQFYITDNGLHTSLTIHLADRDLVGDHDLLGLISAPIVDGPERSIATMAPFNPSRILTSRSLSPGGEIAACPRVSSAKLLTLIRSAANTKSSGYFGLCLRKGSTGPRV